MPPPYPPYGYPPPYQYHQPLGLGPRMPQPMYSYGAAPAWQQEEAAATAKAAAAAAAQKPPPKTEAEPKPVAAADPPPTAATATYQQQPPGKEPPAAAADGYPGCDVAAGGYPPPLYGYPPRHAGGGYHDSGGYPVQGYPTHGDEFRILFKVCRPKFFIYNSVNPFQQFGNNYKIDNMIRYICTK